jgi:hypothetical protein
MCVHHVDGHLHGVEVKLVPVGSLKHAQVHAGIFVPREADVTDCAGLLRFLNGLDGATGREDQSGSSRRMTS